MVAATPSPPALVTNATGVSAGQDLLGARLTATTPATRKPRGGLSLEGGQTFDCPELKPL